MDAQLIIGGTIGLGLLARLCTRSYYSWRLKRAYEHCVRMGWIKETDEV